jgi:Domain of unknown function (DUF4178)
MGTALLVLAAVLFGAAIVVFITALRRPKERRGARPDPLAFTSAAPQFGPRQLGPGAIVSHGGIDYVVRGSVTYHEGPFVWWEHLLEGGDQPIWFSVEDDDGRLKLAMWVSRKELQLEPGGPHTIDDVTYHESEHGRADYTTEGTTGLPADETALLSFERWGQGMPWEVSTGKAVVTGELTVYPAPPAASE